MKAIMISRVLLRKLDLGHRVGKKILRGSVYTRRCRCGWKKPFLREFALYLNLNHPSGGIRCEVMVVTVQVIQAFIICVCILIAKHPRAKSCRPRLTGTRMDARMLIEVIRAREALAADGTLIRALHGMGE
jgi:hypothetical protein